MAALAARRSVAPSVDPRRAQRALCDAAEETPQRWALWWPPGAEHPELAVGTARLAAVEASGLRGVLDALPPLPLDGSVEPDAPSPRIGLFVPFPEAQRGGASAPATLWWPRHRYVRSGAGAWLLTVGPPDELGPRHRAALERLERAARRDGEEASEAPAHGEPTGRWRPEPASRWRSRLAAALEALRGGRLEKLVLGRWAVGRLAAPLSPFEALARWPGGPESQRFAFVGPRGTLLGASPERLLQLRDGRLLLDALAGTAVAPEDFAAKERDEHRLVVDLALADLRRLGLRPEASEVRPSRRGRLWHLHATVSAKLEGEAGIGMLLAALHPSAATCGTPRQAALRWLGEHAPPRGAFAGALGWLAPNEGDAALWVVLRSAWLRGRRARWWSGAGLLAASDAGAETREVLAKLSVAAGALGLRGGEAAP